MEKKLKLYIDTSVWNLVFEIKRENYIITNDFFNLSLKQNCLLVISNVVIAEVSKANDIRRKELSSFIEKHKPLLIYTNEEAILLADLYIKEKLIPERFRDDAIHIATATVNHCDFLVSWNFKHIVKASTIKGVHGINFKEGYGIIEIVSPNQFLGR